MNLVVLCTVPDEDSARRIAQALVAEGLAACVNVLPRLTSVYRWEGEVTSGEELLLIVKTREERYAALEARVKELHPYAVPEVIALPIRHGSKDYLDWLAESTR
ncbi:Divalent-cation tolerance protein CutA [Calidithermus terrae]|uniref:Divalent-cation tolerance protein CutA n=1 Tax=Calidithermus terrae TaxID=1408545 RepID=A0A399EMZ1_9DEIN|nr:divalent-cation tolerance protein CutA [Calidithermus terrae]RIH86074.1 Divalent-cation tolerance protein CutA [Calidithermus terrae]